MAAQQVGAGLQQLTVLTWQHGAGAQAVAHGAGAAWAQQDVCLQHLTLGALQHLTFAGLQQLLASAAPLKAARTARVALNATNFIERLMLSPFPYTMMAGLSARSIEVNKQSPHDSAVQDDSRPTLPGR